MDIGSARYRPSIMEIPGRQNTGFLPPTPPRARIAISWKGIYKTRENVACFRQVLSQSGKDSTHAELRKCYMHTKYKFIFLIPPFSFLFYKMKCSVLFFLLDFSKYV